MTKYNFRTDRTYLPPRPDILPIPQLYDRLKEKNISTLYPAWNLQYYACLCSLNHEDDNILVETGTNNGHSAVLLAQTLRETGLKGHLHTFELHSSRAHRARSFISSLGLADLITVHVGDSRELLPKIVTMPVRFAFIDADHTKEACMIETELLLDQVISGHGKFFYDNTWCGPVDEAICALKAKYGLGGWVDFPNASRCPNGQAIWQPWQRSKPIAWIDPKYNTIGGSE